MRSNATFLGANPLILILSASETSHRASVANSLGLSDADLMTCPGIEVPASELLAAIQQRWIQSLDNCMRSAANHHLIAC